MLKAIKIKHQHNNLFIDIFILLTSVSGVLFCFADYSLNLTLFVIFIAFLTCFLGRFKKQLGFVLPLMFSAFFLLIWNKNIINGFLNITNYLLNIYGEKTLTIVNLYKTDKTDLILIYMFIILILTLIFYTVLEFKCIWFYIFLIVLITACEIFLNLLKILGFILLIISLIFMIYREKLSKTSFKFILKTTVLTSLVFSIFLSIPNIRVNFISKYFENTVESAERIIYEENILPNGDFNNLKSYRPTNNVTLKIVMSSPKTCYLKGFVGDKFKNNKWQGIDYKTLYKNSDLFNALQKNNFYSQTQLSSNLNGKIKIIINNIGACKKFKYIPYMLCDKKILNSKNINDKNIINSAFENSGYSYSVSDFDFNKITPGVTNEEKHYRDFVYKNYTNIDEDFKNIVETLIGKYNSKNNAHYSYKNAKKEISELLGGFTYDKSSINNSNLTDNISNFASVTKSGYSVHFASLATMIFRYLGIPARYVEGYIITKNDVRNKSENSQITLTEKNCHAWVEYYQDGIGWLPFEATPNFSEKVNLPNGFSVKNKKSDNKKIIKEIKKTKETKSTVNYLKNGKHTKKYYYFIPVILLILIIILIDMLKKRKSRDYFVLSVLTLNKKGYKTDGYAIARDNLSKKFFENFEKAKEIYYTKRFSNKEISADDELIIKDFFKTTKHIKRNKK